MPQYIRYDNGSERKVIGTLDTEKKEFSRKVTASKHLYRALDAWGVDAEYFHSVLLPGDYRIRITDTEEKVRYSIQATKILEHATCLHFKSDQRDHGAQLFLPRTYWDKESYAQLPVAPKKNKRWVVGRLPKL